jgi:hypothetical protein
MKYPILSKEQNENMGRGLSQVLLAVVAVKSGTAIIMVQRHRSFRRDLSAAPRNPPSPRTTKPSSGGAA